jgi:plastocyanin/cytochrome c2
MTSRPACPTVMIPRSMRRGARQRARGAAFFAVLAASTFAASGCGLGSQHTDEIRGKQQFVAKCGTCHTLARAETKGTTGPNLDAAFLRARQDGFKNSTIAGMVEGQIRHPSRLPQVDPVTHKEGAEMPANVVTGSDVADVAAYVGQVAGVIGGKDTGRLATVGAKAEGTAKENNGVLDIPVNKAGGLLFQYKDATATAGQVKIDTKNNEQIGHNIALEGNGVNEKGQVVQGGATSTITANLKPGTYTFYCSVPGHREAGMQGKLTVK